MKIRHLLTDTLWLLAWCAAAQLLYTTPAQAGAPLNDQPNWVVGEFPSGTPASVAVDVVEVGSGSTVGDDLPTVQLLMDSADSIFWRFDLSTVNGYPTGCEVATYVIAFEPAGGDCSEGGAPANCFFATRQVGGGDCYATGVSEFYVHTSTVVGAQGISQTVLDFYNQRGVLPLLWIETDRSSSADYTAADSTYYEVYFYTSSASAVRILCTVKTTVDPASALPSYTHCS
jgi:hypothetical protein